MGLLSAPCQQQRICVRDQEQGSDDLAGHSTCILALESFNSNLNNFLKVSRCYPQTKCPAQRGKWIGIGLGIGGGLLLIALVALGLYINYRYHLILYSSLVSHCENCSDSTNNLFRIASQRQRSQQMNGWINERLCNAYPQQNNNSTMKFFLKRSCLEICQIKYIGYKNPRKYIFA